MVYGKPKNYVLSLFLLFLRQSLKIVPRRPWILFLRETNPAAYFLSEFCEENLDLQVLDTSDCRHSTISTQVRSSQYHNRVLTRSRIEFWPASIATSSDVLFNPDHSPLHLWLVILTDLLKWVLVFLLRTVSCWVFSFDTVTLLLWNVYGSEGRKDMFGTNFSLWTIMLSRMHRVGIIALPWNHSQCDLSWESKLFPGLSLSISECKSLCFHAFLTANSSLNLIFCCP